MHVRSTLLALALAFSAASCGGSSSKTEAPKLAGCPPEMVRIPGRHGTGAGAYCLDKTEVTVGAYAECVGRAACTSIPDGRDCNKDDLATQRHPVNCVDWDQGIAYCKSQGKRLPTDDEWEQAAEGMSTAGACWSGAMPQHGTCAVDRPNAPASKDGVLDLAANVAEWTSTGSSDARWVRGGYWSATNAALLGWDTRESAPPKTRSPVIGFRCAKSL